MSRKPITTLDLMRHGEPVGGRRYRGQMDDPLSEKGWAQMRNAVGNHYLFRLQVPNAGITRIRVEKHGGQLFPQLLFHGGNL